MTHTTEGIMKTSVQANIGYFSDISIEELETYLIDSYGTSSYPKCLEDSLNPTSSPNLPTNIPSYSPTFAPTSTPSYSPTFAPTLSPKLLPSVSPTLSPTLSPKFLPTVSPTLLPTLSPVDDICTNKHKQKKKKCNKDKKNNCIFKNNICRIKLCSDNSKKKSCKKDKKSKCLYVSNNCINQVDDCSYIDELACLSDGCSFTNSTCIFPTCTNISGRKNCKKSKKFCKFKKSKGGCIDK